MHDLSYESAEDVAAELRKGLSALVRRGGSRPQDLIFETPETLHALRELGLGAEGQLETLLSEEIAAVIEDLPTADAQAARIMLGLDAAARGTRLGERRERAAKILKVAPGTFRNRQEGRILDSVSRAVALALLSSVLEPEIKHSALAPGQVVLIHRKDSFGVKEVGQLVESLGLHPVLLQQALDRAGLSSPSVVDRFRLCLETAQAVIVVLEAGPGEANANLAFEAGLALGLAGPRTVIVQLGDQAPLEDLNAVNVLRLRNTQESLTVLGAALRAAGCEIQKEPGELSNRTKTGLDIGWYRWTPERATDPIFADLAASIEKFEPLKTDSGRAAASWLREHALDEYPGVATYLRIANSRLEGFVALQAGSIHVTASIGRGSTQGATFLRWIARDRNSPETGEDLLAFAAARALEAADTVGSVALVLDAYDEEEAQLWESRYPFRRLVGQNPLKLWLPMSKALTDLHGDTDLASPMSAT